MIAALNLYLAIMWVDILPNGTFTLLPYFLGGALCSMTRVLGEKRPERSAAASERERARRPSTSRQPPDPGTAVAPHVPSTS
jgi:hypothetical protein